MSEQSINAVVANQGPATADRARIVAVLAIVVFAAFFGLWAYPLLDNNEGLYASIARNMAVSGDFIIPSANGVPYLEKPPMLYWLVALSIRLFGASEAAVRLVPATALFGTILLSRQLALRVYRSPEVANLTALIFASSVVVITMGRMVMFDMLMTVFLTAALASFHVWYQRVEAGGAGARRFMVLFHALMALAVLTKGFVALVLAGGAILAFLALSRAPLSRYLGLFDPLAVAVFLAIAAPWHVAASLQQAGFAWFYFINEHVLRFLNMREPHDYYGGPAWYYLPRLLIYLFPWSFFLWLLLPTRKPAAARETGEARDFERLMWCWAGVALLFFSLSSAKANYYMLAGLPPIIILLARRLSAFRWPLLLLAISSFNLVALMVALITVRSFCHAGSGDLYPPCTVLTDGRLWLTGAVLAVLALLQWRLPRRDAFFAVSASIFVLVPLLVAGVNGARTAVSQRIVADYLNSQTTSPVAVFGDFEKMSSLAFYMAEPMEMVDSYSADLYYGRQLTGSPLFIGYDEWRNRPELSLMVVRRPHLARLLNGDNPPCVRRSFGKVTVVDNCRPSP